MKVLALVATQRKSGNSDILTDIALQGVKDGGGIIEKIYLKDIFIKPCKGCLRCNILGYCSIKDDDFNKFKDKFLKSDAIILSSPVYYHYITGQMKVLIDRFRSTFYVKITPEGLEHTFIYEKGKTFLFILTLGHPEITDALPAIESLKLWVKTTCKNPVILKPIIATFLALPNQINASKEKLEKIFTKMKIPLDILDEKYDLYQNLLDNAYRSGRILANK